MAQAKSIASTSLSRDRSFIRSTASLQRPESPDMTNPEPSAWSELNTAVVCSLIYRFDPTPTERSDLPQWKQLACSLPPKTHRWRVRPLAPRIAAFNLSAGSTPSSCRNTGAQPQHHDEPIGSGTWGHKCL